MSDGSASCAQDWSLALRPWSCPSSPCQMTSWPTSHGSCVTQRQPVGSHEPAAQVIGSCAIGCQSFKRNGGRQLLRPRLQCKGHGVTLCTAALKHQRTGQRPIPLHCWQHRAGHAVWHHTAYSRCRQSQQTVESPTALPPKRIRSFDDCFQERSRVTPFWIQERMWTLANTD